MPSTSCAVPSDAGTCGPLPISSEAAARTTASRTSAPVCSPWAATGTSERLPHHPTVIAAVANGGHVLFCEKVNYAAAYAFKRITGDEEDCYEAWDRHCAAQPGPERDSIDMGEDFDFDDPEEMRHRLPRLCPQGILFVLHTGIQWEWLPQEVGFGSGTTCRRRLRDWHHEAGMWDRLHQSAADRAAPCREAGLVPGGDRRLPPPGPPGRPQTGPSPVERARPGSKHHVNRRRQHLASHHPDWWQPSRHHPALPLLDAIPRIRGVTGRPRRRPRQLFADRGYDFDKYPRLLRKRGIEPVVARRGVPLGSGLGSVR